MNNHQSYLPSANATAMLATALREGYRKALRLGTAQEERARFSPALSYGRHFGPPSPTAKPAAIMLHLERFDVGAGLAGWRIPLTVRPMHLPDHPGQVSFPGGRLEGQESPEQAARREFCEELGVERFTGTIACELSPLNVYNSDYSVHPFVSFGTHVDSYRPCPVEVDRLIFLPLTDLLARTHLQIRTFERGGVRWTAPAICLGQDVVWGATAVMLGELVAVIEAIDDPQVFEWMP